MRGRGCVPPAPSSRGRLVPSQVSVPPGALDCWVFLSCLEVLQRIEGCCDRAHLDANSAHTVGLWSYATEKVPAPDAGVALAWAAPPGADSRSEQRSLGPRSVPMRRFWLL